MRLAADARGDASPDGGKGHGGGHVAHHQFGQCRLQLYDLDLPVIDALVK